MTTRFPEPPELAMHPGEELLAGYAAGVIDELAAWSLEAHVGACSRCREAVSAHVDPHRLAQNGSVLLVRTALDDDGRFRRVLRRCGAPDHLLGLLAATPSLRRSWLLGVVAVLTVVTGESLLVGHLWNGPLGHPGLDGAVLVPFLLVAPLLVLAGVAAAFMPLFDPAYPLAVAAPFDAFTLLLVRVLSALTSALVPVVVAAFIVPGPWWLPAALLLPSLALCGLALALGSVVGPRAAAISSAGLWVSSVLLVVVGHPPLATVEWHGQAACAVVLLTASAVLCLRRDRFDYGWTR
jgi:hypothetical protein